MGDELTNDVKNIFVSYSWSGDRYQEKVKRLVDDLIASGINVTVDFYDLNPGNDTFAFMEKMVSDEKIDKVLILIDPKYSLKANKKEATGVSTETQIITPHVYRKTNQNKFIPIIMEKEETGELKLPIYLEGRLYIDLSSEIEYHPNLEKIVREINDKPLLKKPKLGTAPSYLNEDKEIFETKILMESLKHKIKNTLSKEKQFFEVFLRDIEKAREIDFENYDNNLEKINNATIELDSLKEDYVIFLEYYTLFEEFDIDILIDFFEKIYEYSLDKSTGIIVNGKYDHIEFLITELYIYTCIVLLDNKKYKELEILLGTDYYLSKRQLDFTWLRLPPRILKEKEPRRYNYIADLYINRTVFNGKNYKKKFIDMDLLLFYISVIRNKEKNKQGSEIMHFNHIWYPTTFFYLGYEEKVLSIQKMSSERHCKNMMDLFGIKTIDELKQNFKNFSDFVDLKNYRLYEYSVPHIEYHISSEILATKL